MTLEIYVFKHQFEEQFNIEIQTIFNSQCVFLLFGKTSNEFRLQFNVKQSSTTKLLLLSVPFMQCKVILNISSSPSNLWLTKAKPFNYADDTTTSCKGKDTKKIIEDLESEAQEVFHFMASDGLVANAQKTVFMMLNNPAKENDSKLSIKIGTVCLEQKNLEPSLTTDQRCKNTTH